MDQNPHYYHHVIIRKTLQFLVPVSIIYFLISYFSGFPVLTHEYFSSLIFPIFHHGLDRKYMFLICNGILAFLAKNLKLSSSGLIINNIGEDGLKQNISEMPLVIKEAEIIYQENAASMDFVEDVKEEEKIVERQEEEEEEEEQDCDGSHKEAEEIIKTEALILENEDWDIDEDYDDEEEEVESASLNDVRVSTEELNKKFEEFIRKMKEEIRIEARQHLIAV